MEESIKEASKQFKTRTNQQKKKKPRRTWTLRIRFFIGRKTLTIFFTFCLPEIIHLHREHCETHAKNRSIIFRVAFLTFELRRFTLLFLWGGGIYRWADAFYNRPPIFRIRSYCLWMFLRRRRCRRRQRCRRCLHSTHIQFIAFARYHLIIRS